MQTVELKQNSDEWLEFRKDKIGASDAPIILGTSPFSSPRKLWENKTSGVNNSYFSPAMAHGRDTEAEALHVANTIFASNFAPLVGESDEHHWMIASFDGYEEGEESILEIKCPGENTLKKIHTSGEFPEYYYAQLQHQMYVAEVSLAKLFIYNSKFPDLPNYFIFEVKIDENFCKDMIQKEKEFFDSLSTFAPPADPKDSLEERVDAEFEDAVSDWLKAKEGLELMQEQEKICKESVLFLANNSECKGFGVRVTKRLRKGSIDYTKVLELKSVDLSKYRKMDSEFWVVQKESDR